MVAAGGRADTRGDEGSRDTGRSLCLFVLVSPAWSGAAGGSAVGVSEREWSVTLSRLKVQHGAITFSIHNFGQDDHNIKIRKHGSQYGFSGRIRSGGTATITVNLKPASTGCSAASPGTVRWV